MFNDLIKYPWVKQAIYCHCIKDIVPKLLAEL